jgi:peroxiredoxin
MRVAGFILRAVILTVMFSTCFLIVSPPTTAAADDAARADAEAILVDLGPAPVFTLPSYAGARVSLTDYLGHGPVIVDFWATWCAPCRRALPGLQALYDRYRERGLSVLAISTDDPRNQPKIGPFLRAQKLTFPVLLDGENRVARQFHVTTVPATFIVSAEGRLMAIHRGYRDGDEAILEKEILALLGDESRELDESAPPPGAHP